MRTLGIFIVLLFLVGPLSYQAYFYIVEHPPVELWGFVQEAVTKRSPLPEMLPLSVPEGFRVSIFSHETPGARVMIRDPKGTMLVSLTKDGKIVALPDFDHNGEADRTVMLLEGLRQPHGLYMHCPQSDTESAAQDACVLYVAETGELKTYGYDADTFTATYQETITTFPTGAGHFTRTLYPHPDGVRLLISVGSSCNVCNEEDARRASILALNLETKEVTTFATGLRNTVFMATDPVSGEVWGTENGRDLIDDLIPPDEINILTEGKNYGWPLCYGTNIHDTYFDKNTYVQDPCGDKVPAHIELPAHVAALGLAFIPEEGWPEDMANDALVAYHGSWNRSKPTGYKVARIDLQSDTRRATGQMVDFLAGFLEPGASRTEAMGRPVGLLVEPGGVAYVSDDHAGVIYRITRIAEE